MAASLRPSGRIADRVVDPASPGHAPLQVPLRGTRAAQAATPSLRRRRRHARQAWQSQEAGSGVRSVTLVLRSLCGDRCAEVLRWTIERARLPAGLRRGASQDRPGRPPTPGFRPASRGAWDVQGRSCASGRASPGGRPKTVQLRLAESNPQYAHGTRRLARFGARSAGAPGWLTITLEG